MERAYRQTVVIGPEGRVEIPKTELEPGTEAEVVLLPIARRAEEGDAPPDREAILKRMWDLSDKAIAEGMELWDIDRVNAEVHERRYGDRERY